MAAKTLGQDFADYLTAQQELAATQAKLAADTAVLATTTTVFTVDLAASGVKALLAPASLADGSTPVAIVNPDGTFTVISAAAPSTTVTPPEVTPVTPPTA